MFIDSVDPGSASGPTAQIYAEAIEDAGFLPEYVRAFSHHPEAYLAWRRLVTTLYEGMDRRRCELATLAAAREMRSTCCAIAHGKTLRDRFFPAEQVERIAANHHDAGLPDVEVAIMDFAEKAAADASSVTQDDVEHLKSFGLSDRDIFDIVFAVATRAFFTTLIESLGAIAEAPWVEDLEPELVQALSVGRPARS